MNQEIYSINDEVYGQYARFTKEKVGRVDELTIPSTITVLEKQWGYLFLPKEAGAIDTLVVFVHSGIRVPEGFDNLLNIGTPEDIANLAESILLNVDLGGALVASRVLQQLNDNPSTAVLWYDYTRVVGDPNRIALDEQLPHKAFRGESPWTSEADTPEKRKPLADATILPFFADLTQIIEQHNPKLIVSPHTYDPVGGGVVSSSIIDTMGNSLRPAGMIFQENTFDPQLQTLLTPEQLAKMKELYLQTLQRLSTLQESRNVTVTVDEPYKIGLTLVVWLQLLQRKTHFMYEMRKDMFEQITDKDIDELAQLIFSARTTLL